MLHPNCGMAPARNPSNVISVIIRTDPKPVHRRNTHSTLQYAAPINVDGVVKS